MPGEVSYFRGIPIHWDQPVEYPDPPVRPPLRYGHRIRCICDAFHVVCGFMESGEAIVNCDQGGPDRFPAYFMTGEYLEIWRRAR